MSQAADAQKRPDKATGASVVFLGSFNPVIFQPAWFMRHRLIPDDEESIEMEAVAQPVAAWSQPPLRVVVQPEKCEFTASDEVASFATLNDLAQGVFSLLSHVPLTAFGVNRFVHFQMESEDAWHDLGFSLFRPDPWAGVLDDARMRTVQVQSRRPNNEDGAMIVTVQPSAQFTNAVFVATNDHYDINAKAADADEALTRLAEVFEQSLERSDEIIERVRGL
jgi:hypothetical protein